MTGLIKKGSVALLLAAGLTACGSAGYGPGYGGGYGGGGVVIVHHYPVIIHHYHTYHTYHSYRSWHH